MDLKKKQYNECEQYFKMTKGQQDLYAPNSFWGAEIQEIKRICNGCGAGGWKFDIIPDKLLGLSIYQACQIHDWMYNFAKKEPEFKEYCDRMFLKNMNTLIKNGNAWLRYPRYYLAKWYYRGVRIGGDSSFY